MLLTCLTSLDLTKQVNLLLIHQKPSSWTQTSKIGGQLYSDTSPNEVSEYSLVSDKVKERNLSGTNAGGGGVL